MVYLAGQITGVEGYTESAACGLLAAIFVEQRLTHRPHLGPPANTALGALLKYIVGSEPKNFQPTNINFGLMDPLLFDGLNQGKRIPKDQARAMMAEQSLVHCKTWLKDNLENLY